jgi:hypothetical protein
VGPTAPSTKMTGATKKRGTPGGILVSWVNPEGDVFTLKGNKALYVKRDGRIQFVGQMSDHVDVGKMIENLRTEGNEILSLHKRLTPEFLERSKKRKQVLAKMLPEKREAMFERLHAAARRKGID